MLWVGQEPLFRKAMDLYRREHHLEATAILRQILASGNRDPRVLSYAGLLIATAEGNVREGLDLCDRAVRRAAYDPIMYLNLGRLHAATGWRSKAAEVLRRGLGVDPGNEELAKELNRLNPRRPRAVSFLSRTHPLNRYLGRWNESDRKKGNRKWRPQFS